MKIANCRLGGNPGGTSLHGYLDTSFAQLVEVLGPPNGAGDGHKVSTEWYVTFNDETFTLYDYKDTSLYNEENPSVEEFRKLPSFEWHIGARSERNVEIFKNAVLAAIAGLKQKAEEI